MVSELSAIANFLYLGADTRADWDGGEEEAVQEYELWVEAYGQIAEAEQDDTRHQPE